MTYGLLDLVKDHMAGTVQLVPPAVAAQRLAICRACDRFMPKVQTCGICYCYMPEKVKHADSECAQNPPIWQSHPQQ